MKILALDLSIKRTGWALGQPSDDPPANGSVSFDRPWSANGLRWRLAADWVANMISAHAPDVITFEGPLAPSFIRGHTTTDTVRALMGVIAIAELAAYGYDVREHAVSDIRNFFLGTNRIKSRDAKQQTFDRCVRLGWKPKDKDAADALALWAYQVSLIDPAQGVRLLPLFGRRVAV